MTGNGRRRLFTISWTMRVKYTGPGGSIVIRVVRGEIFTEIHVSDSGKGIALERQAQIFTRFYREPEVHDQEGVGIGLYLTRKIAEPSGRLCPGALRAGKGIGFLYLSAERVRTSGRISWGETS